MKIIILLLAAFCAFGLATKEAVSVKATQQKVVAESSKVYHTKEVDIENQVSYFMEIAVNSQDMIAGI